MPYGTLETLVDANITRFSSKMDTVDARLRDAASKDHFAKLGLDVSDVAAGVRGVNKMLSGIQKHKAVLQFEAVGDVQMVRSIGDIEKATRRATKAIGDDSDIAKRELAALDQELKEIAQDSAKAAAAEKKYFQSLDSTISKANSSTEEYQRTINKTQQLIDQANLSNAKTFSAVERAKDKAARAGRPSAAERGEARLRLTDDFARNSTYAGAAVLGSLGYTTKQAVDFDGAMRNVNSIAQVSEKNLQQLESRLLKIAADPQIRQGPKDLASGLYDVYSSGFKGKAALDVLQVSAKGATAGLTSTAISGRALMAVLNSGIPGVQNAQHGMDLLFKTVDRGVLTFPELARSIGQVLPISAKAGVNLSEVGAALAVMTKSGMSAQRASTDLLNLINKIAAPSKQARDNFKELGIAYGFSTLQAKGLPAVLADIEKKTGGNADALKKLFPDLRAARGALSLLKNGGHDYRVELGEMSKAAEREGAMQRALAKQHAGTSGSVAIARKEFELLSVQVGQKTFPALNSLLKIGNSLFDRFNKLSPSTQDNVVKFGLLAGAGLVVTGRMAGLVRTLADVRIALGLTSAAATTTAGATGIGAITSAVGKLRAVLSNPITIGIAIGGAGYDYLQKNGYVNGVPLGQVGGHAKRTWWDNNQAAIKAQGRKFREGQRATSDIIGTMYGGGSVLKVPPIKSPLAAKYGAFQRTPTIIDKYMQPYKAPVFPNPTISTGAKFNPYPDSDDGTGTSGGRRSKRYKAFPDTDTRLTLQYNEARRQAKIDAKGLKPLSLKGLRRNVPDAFKLPAATERINDISARYSTGSPISAEDITTTRNQFLMWQSAKGSFQTFAGFQKIMDGLTESLNKATAATREARQAERDRFAELRAGEPLLESVLKSGIDLPPTSRSQDADLERKRIDIWRSREITELLDQAKMLQSRRQYAAAAKVSHQANREFLSQWENAQGIAKAERTVQFIDSTRKRVDELASAMSKATATGAAYWNKAFPAGIKKAREQQFSGLAKSMGGGLGDMGAFDKRNYTGMKREAVAADKALAAMQRIENQARTRANDELMRKVRQDADEIRRTSEETERRLGITADRISGVMDATFSDLSRGVKGVFDNLLYSTTATLQQIAVEALKNKLITAVLGIGRDKGVASVAGAAVPAILDGLGVPKGAAYNPNTNGYSAPSVIPNYTPPIAPTGNAPRGNNIYGGVQVIVNGANANPRQIGQEVTKQINKTLNSGGVGGHGHSSQGVTRHRMRQYILGPDA